MNKIKVTKVVKLFETLILTQDRYNKLYNELSDEEEAEFERQIMSQRFTIDKTKEMKP